MDKKAKTICIILVVLTSILLIVKMPMMNKNFLEKIKSNDLIEIELGQTIELNEKPRIVLELIDIRDSRCLGNITCNWQGELLYKISINDEKYDIGTVSNNDIYYNNYKITIVPEKCTEKVLAIKIKRIDNVVKIKLNEMFTISKSQTAIFNNEFELKISSVSDSRCSREEGVVCVWEGELAYHILINGEEYELSTVMKKELIYKDYKITIVEEKCGIGNLSAIVEKN